MEKGVRDRRITLVVVSDSLRLSLPDMIQQVRHYRSPKIPVYSESRVTQGSYD
jgi:hypothetical protein